jgi:twitching motility two-component system response regulator PilH
MAPKVLVVDDSWTDLTLMTSPLREEGFEIITAADGDEALEKAWREQPNVILLDVVLPKQNGFQVCRRLREAEQSKNIPVILVSGKDTPMDQRWGLQQGADFYITKPFSPEDLIEKIRSVIGNPR